MALLSAVTAGCTPHEALDLEAALHRALGQRTNLSCPNCEGSIHHCSLNSVSIEVCALCRGVFLDAGEIDRLREQSLARSAATRGSGSWLADACDPFELILEVILEALGSLSP
jgi:hypothetical protein